MCIRDSYDRGRRASAANPESVRVRLQLFETAISMDSTFADAWAWLSEWHFRMGVYTQDRAVLDRGEALARHAIELDPDSEMAHLALAQNLWSPVGSASPGSRFFAHSI